MDDNQNPLLEINDRLSLLRCRSIIAALTFKHLLAETATINRSPEDAQKFVDKIRSDLENFTRMANSDGSRTDEMFKREMLDYIEIIFSGISFDQGAKP